MITGTPLPVVVPSSGATPHGVERERLVRRVRLLARIGLAWHFIEAGVAVGAGVLASSVALVGFGADSLIEVAAGLIVLWLMAGQRSASQGAERRAQQLIAASFVLLAVYVVAQAGREFVGDHHPAVSWVGIALAAVTLLTMSPLAAAKRRLGRALGSAATTSESRQTMLCA